MLQSQLETVHSSCAADLANLSQKLVEEASLRLEAEYGLKKMEHELEDLSRSVFEEANRLVGEEARRRDAVERENGWLRAQWEEMRELLAMAREEIGGLKRALGGEGALLAKSCSAPQFAGLAEKKKSPGRRRRSLSAGPRTKLRSKRDAMHLDHPHLAAIKTQPAVLSPGVGESPLSADHYRKAIGWMEKEMELESKKSLMPMVAESLGFDQDSGIFSDMNTSVLTTPGQEDGDSGDWLQSDGEDEGLESLSIPQCLKATSELHIHTQRFAEFVDFLAQLEDQRANPMSVAKLAATKFVKRAIAEDVNPTLPLEHASWFASRQLKQAVLDNQIVLLTLRVASPVPATCHACHTPTPQSDVAYFFHLDHVASDEPAERLPLCKVCHTRLRTCCAFWHFVRLLQRGCFSPDTARVPGSGFAQKVFAEYLELKVKMCLARSGVVFDD